MCETCAEHRHEHEHAHVVGLPENASGDDFRVVVTGKGGVGKTTLTALLARQLARRNYCVLAVDADPQMNLPYVLGLRDADARALVPLSENADYVEEKTGTRPGEGWGLFFRLNPNVDDVVGRFGVRGPDGVRLLVMGNTVQPAVLADVNPDMRISRDELFGPAVAVSPAADIDEAIKLANDKNYGLSAGVFTQNLDAAVKFARQVHAGNIQINWGPAWRADLMPYGGLGDSGIGKEGPKYAVEEMTELKTVIIHQS